MKRLLLLLLAAFFTIGCGSETNDFVAVSTGTSNTQQRPFAGKLFLGEGIPNAQISIEDLNGQNLATTTTDMSGNYILTTSLPPDFRVFARVGTNLVFAREIRDFGTTPTFGAITIPTTLASGLSQANPSRPLPDIESEVRRLLQIPQNVRLDSMTESVGSSFSHLAFFVRAAQNGGIESYLNALLANDAAIGSPFLLRRDTVGGSLAGIEPQVADVLARLQANPNLVRSTQRLISRGIQNPVIGQLGSTGVGNSGTASAIRAQELAAADVLKFIGTNIGSAIIGQVTTTATSTGYTWVAEQLGGHFGTTVELDAISAQLDDIQTQLDQIVSLLTDAAISAQVTTLNGFKDDIKAKQNSLFMAYDDTKQDADYFNNMPAPNTLPQSVQNTLDTLSADSTLNALTNDVDKLQEYLTGSTKPSTTTALEYPPILVNTSSSGTTSQPNLLLELRNSVLSQNGIVVNSDTQQFGNFPVRSSVLLDQIMGPFEGYGQAQVLGANLIGEAAHQSSNPQNQIRKAQAYADNVARSLQNSRAQLPGYPESDRYFIDLQNGLMWHMYAQGPRDVDDAQDWAETYRGDDGNTSGWHLPSWDELKTLQLRAAWAAGNGNSYDFSNTMAGLSKLGFDLSAITNIPSSVNGQSTFANNVGEPYVLTADWTFDSGVFGSNDWGFDEGLRFTLTSNNFSEEPLATVNGERAAFFVCRTLGSEPCIDINPPRIASGSNNGNWPSSFNAFPKESEEPSVAVFTGFESPSITSTAVSLTGTYVFNVGDQSYTVGNASTTATAGTNYTRSNTYSATRFVPPTYFLTNDNAGSTVSSYPSDFGTITNHVNSTQATTVTLASLGLVGGVFPSVIQRTFTLSTPGTTQISLKQLQISPRNRTFDLETTDSVDQQFVAVGFYSDNSVQDLTNRVTWTVVDQSTGNPTPGATFANDQAGLLVLKKSDGLTVNLLTVKATIAETSGNPTSSGSDSTSIRVLLD
jgi:hypothetical protein